MQTLWLFITMRTIKEVFYANRVDNINFLPETFSKKRGSRWVNVPAFRKRYSQHAWICLCKLVLKCLTKQLSKFCSRESLHSANRTKGYCISVNNQMNNYYTKLQCERLQCKIHKSKILHAIYFSPWSLGA